MKNLKIKSTKLTPDVFFSLKKGYISIKGISIPDNTHTFYLPLFDYLQKYSENPKDITYLKIQLEYFNTATSKFLFDFFKKTSEIESDVIVDWIYEEDDEDIIEAGEDFESLISGIKFNFIEVEES